LFRTGDPKRLDKPSKHSVSVNLFVMIYFLVARVNKIKINYCVLKTILKIYFNNSLDEKAFLAPRCAVREWSTWPTSSHTVHSTQRVLKISSFFFLLSPRKHSCQEWCRYPAGALDHCQEWCEYPAGALDSCQEWCRNWPIESLTQAFPRVHH